MIQGSTPVLTVRVTGRDLTTAQRIRLTIRQHGTPHNVDKDRLTAVTDDADTLLLLHLTQQETLALDPGRVQHADRQECELHLTAAQPEVGAHRVLQ